MNELKETQYLFCGNDNDTPEKVCEKRTCYCLKWYIQKACNCKRMYYLLSIIALLGPILISVEVVWIDEDKITVLITAVVTLVSSLLNLMRVQEKWENYRTAAEYLKKEYTLFCAHASPYDGQDRCSTYINEIEAYMQQVHKRWTNLFKEKNIIDQH